MLKYMYIVFFLLDKFFIINISGQENFRGPGMYLKFCKNHISALNLNQCCEVSDRVSVLSVYSIGSILLRFSLNPCFLIGRGHVTCKPVTT